MVEDAEFNETARIMVGLGSDGNGGSSESEDCPTALVLLVFEKVLLLSCLLESETGTRPGEYIGEAEGEAEGDDCEENRMELEWLCFLSNSNFSWFFSLNSLSY